MSEFRSSSVPGSASDEPFVLLEREIPPIDQEAVAEGEISSDDLDADRLAEIMRRRFSGTEAFRSR